jgi:uncharacterized protein DUF4272
MFAWLKKKNAPPDARAVMKRAIILKYLFVKGLATPPPEYLAECKEKWGSDEWGKFLHDVQSQNTQLVERLHQSELWGAMGEEERNFMQTAPTELTRQALIEVSWRAESIVCLLWALGHISELLPYDQQAAPDLTKKLPAESAEVLIRKATLRPHEFLEKQRGLAELWHWRSRTRQLQESGYAFTLPDGVTMEKILEMASARAAADGAIPTPIAGDFPAFGKPYRDLTHDEYFQVRSIAQERHLALNWLCGLAPDNRWAETPTDT